MTSREFVTKSIGNQQESRGKPRFCRENKKLTMTLSVPPTACDIIGRSKKQSPLRQDKTMGQIARRRVWGKTQQLYGTGPKSHVAMHPGVTNRKRPDWRPESKYSSPGKRLTQDGEEEQEKGEMKRQRRGKNGLAG